MKKLLVPIAAAASVACSNSGNEPDPQTDFIRGTEWEYFVENKSRISLDFINAEQAILYISEFEFRQAGALWTEDHYNETVSSYYYDYSVSGSNNFDMVIAPLPWGDPDGPQSPLPDDYKDMPPLSGRIDDDSLLLQNTDRSTYAILNRKK